MDFKVNVLQQVCFLALISLCISIYIPPGPKYRCPEKTKAIYPCVCLNGGDKGLFIRCENSNLASLSVAFEHLARLEQPIENVTIYKCHIERLYGTIFFNASVRILQIENTPVKLVEEHAFYGINETLQELHFINTELIEFPSQALKSLGLLTVLNIDHHRIQKLAKDIFAESGAGNRLEKLHFINGPLDDLPVESFQVLRKLKTLDLHGNNLSTLKRNQFKNLRDVDILDISYNNITKLESQHISDMIKLGFCNVSNNALTEISRGTFARNSILKVLNMSFNKIKRLDSNSFRGMRILRRLFLNDNLIADVGRGTFGSVTRIGTIDLARNFIKKIDYQMFYQLNFVEKIDVSENNITEIEKQSFKDLYLTDINISHNQIAKIQNFAFENCANITKLDLSHNLLKIFERNTFDSTTYATEFQLSYNMFTDLSRIPLHNMTGLKILNVSYNTIEQIPKNTFPKLYELHTIDVSHNDIKLIANAVFQNLFSLRNLNLSYNSLEDIKSSMFGTLPTLLEMDLSYNKLTEIARGALTKLTSLRILELKNNMLEKLFQIPISLNSLNLQNNWLQNVPEHTWPQMNALLTLDLSGNRLSNNLVAGSFSGLLTLQTLYLNANGISEIPAESLAGLTTLQYLHLENNNITKLPKAAFGKLPVVFVLNLYNNNIDTVSVRAFDGLLQLLTLNLSSNALKTIPNDAFIGLVSLRKMDLSQNMIEKLDNRTNGVLDDCLSLEFLNISHNRISFITRKTFPSNPYIPYKLNEIDLSYNRMPVMTYDITFGTKKLKKLTLSHNMINDIRKYVLGNLTSLEILDLSNNGLSDLSSEQNIFNLPSTISELYLQNNKIWRLPYDQLIKVQNLSKVDLRNNALEEFSLELSDLVKNKTEIYFTGNPLKCNCGLRPLIHYLNTLTDIPEHYGEIECAKPIHLAGTSLFNVTDNQLNCLSGVETGFTDNEIFDILPDIRFRDVIYSNGKLLLRWYVTSRNDVSDFYVNVRDEKSTVYFDQQLAYNKRIMEISGDIIHKAITASKLVQVCVLAKNSVGVIGKWFDSQCIDIPENFESIINKYKFGYNYAYTLFSIDPRKSTSRSRSSATTILSEPLYMYAVTAFLYFIINKFL